MERRHMVVAFEVVGEKMRKISKYSNLIDTALSEEKMHRRLYHELMAQYKKEGSDELRKEIEKVVVFGVLREIRNNRGRTIVEYIIQGLADIEQVIFRVLEFTWGIKTTITTYSQHKRNTTSVTTVNLNPLNHRLKKDYLSADIKVKCVQNALLFVFLKILINSRKKQRKQIIS